MQPLPPRSITVVGVVFFASLSALGQFTTNLYVPWISEIAAQMGSEPVHIQHSLTTFLVGFALFQLVFGPLSDRLGRRKVLVFGLGLFIASTLGCVGARGAVEFAVFRFLQGVASASTIVVSRAIVRDTYGGEALARMISAVLMGFAGLVAIGPALGGFFGQIFGWRMSFVIALIFSVGLLAVVDRRLKETSPEADGQTLAQHFRSYVALMRSRRFLAPVLLLSCLGGIWYAFLAEGPLLFVGAANLDPAAFGGLSTIALSGYVFGSLYLNVTVRRNRTSTNRLMERAAALMLCFGLSLAASELVADISIRIVTITLVVTLFMATMGVFLPLAIARSMDQQAARAGAAAAALGFLQMAFAALGTFLVTQFSGLLDFPLGTTVLCFVVLGGVLLLVVQQENAAARSRPRV